MTSSSLEGAAMGDRQSVSRPLRGSWLMRLARKRRLFHEALVGTCGAPRRRAGNDAVLGLPVVKPRIRR